MYFYPPNLDIWIDSLTKSPNSAWPKINMKSDARSMQFIRLNSFFKHDIMIWYDESNSPRYARFQHKLYVLSNAGLYSKSSI